MANLNKYFDKGLKIEIFFVKDHEFEKEVLLKGAKDFVKEKVIQDSYQITGTLDGSQMYVMLSSLEREGSLCRVIEFLGKKLFKEKGWL